MDERSPSSRLIAALALPALLGCEAAWIDGPVGPADEALAVEEAALAAHPVPMMAFEDDLLLVEPEPSAQLAARVEPSAPAARSSARAASAPLRLV